MWVFVCVRAHMCTGFVLMSTPKPRAVYVTVYICCVDAKEGLTFLESIEIKDDPQPELLLNMEKARKHNQLKDYAEVKKILAEGRKSIDASMNVMEPIVHSHFYLASLEYYQVRFFCS